MFFCFVVFLMCVFYFCLYFICVSCIIWIEHNNRSHNSNSKNKTITWTRIYQSITNKKNSINWDRDLEWFFLFFFLKFVVSFFFFSFELCGICLFTVLYFFCLCCCCSFIIITRLLWRDLWLGVTSICCCWCYLTV